MDREDLEKVFSEAELDAVRAVADKTIADTLTAVSYHLRAVQDLLRMTECLNAQSSLELNAGIDDFLNVVTIVSARQIGLLPDELDDI